MTTYADATDKTVDTWKQGARALSERMELLVTMPSLDFVEPVQRYFDYLLKAVELNRELATRWAELVTQLSGTFRDELLNASHTVEEQVEGMADKAGELALKGKDAADKLVDEAGQVVAEAKDKAGKVVDDVKGTAEDVVDEATGKSKELTDKATDTAEDLADDAAETASKATSRTRRR